MKKMSDANKKITASDVARIAGVSRTQVSYVLNRDESKHVSDEKRRKILTVAKEMGYQPSQSAQALRKGYANEFALFFPAPYTSRINSMLGFIHEEGLVDGCMPIQYSFNSYRNSDRKQSTLDSLLARKPRGIFLSLLDVSIEDINYIHSRGIENILVYDIEPHEEFLTLQLPVETIGFMAAQHLLNKGHRKIGIIKPSDPIQQKAYRLRFIGMKKALQNYAETELVEFSWPAEEIRPSLRKVDRFILENQLGKNNVSGIYTFSDDYGLPLIAGLMDQGIQIPKDLALIGTDDDPVASIIRPSLTTINFDQESFGLRAVNMINSLITKCPLKSDELKPVTPYIVQRQTT